MTRTLTTGSRDSCIWDLDLRCPGFPKTALRSKHTQEGCGLSWSPDGRTLASGGNENLLCLWDARCSRPEPRVASKAHAAAVKAIAWSPDKRSLLATFDASLALCPADLESTPEGYDKDLAKVEAYPSFDATLTSDAAKLAEFCKYLVARKKAAVVSKAPRVYLPPQAPTAAGGIVLRYRT